MPDTRPAVDIFERAGEPGLLSRRGFLAASGGALSLAALAACGQGSSGGPTGETLTAPIVAEPKTMNPNWRADPGAYYPANNIFSSLVTLPSNATEVVPQLARGWDVSTDATTYTFHLRDDVTWHDGKPFTSADAEYTFNTILQQKYPMSNYLDGATISAPDPATLVVRFEKPNVPFLPLFAQASNWYGYVLPKHLYNGTDWSSSPANDKPVGTGPFTFVSWQKGSRLTLARNEKYFGGTPAVTKLIFDFVADPQVALAGFESKKYQFLSFDYMTNYALIKRYMDQSADGQVQVPTEENWYNRDIQFNLSSRYLSDARVRQAIAYGIDRDQINTQAFGGIRKVNYHPGSEVTGQWLDKDVAFPRHDSQRANDLLDSAGYSKHGDSRFTVRILIYPLAELVSIGEVIVQQLRQIGIASTVRKVDKATFLTAAKAGDFDIAIYFTRYGPDPDAYAAFFQTKGPNNYTGYSNKNVDSWLGQARRTPDVAVRKELYDKVQAQLVEDLPYVVLFANTHYSLQRKGWSGFPSTGAQSHPTGWFSYFNVEKARG